MTFTKRRGVWEKKNNFSIFYFSFLFGTKSHPLFPARVRSFATPRASHNARNGVKRSIEKNFFYSTLSYALSMLHSVDREICHGAEASGLSSTGASGMGKHTIISGGGGGR